MDDNPHVRQGLRRIGEGCHGSLAMRLHGHRNLQSKYNHPGAARLLDVAQESLCSEPHDKIYGLLGILRTLEMPIDYTRSVTEYSPMAFSNPLTATTTSKTGDVAIRTE